MALGATLLCGPNGGISGNVTHLQGEAVGGQTTQGALRHATYRPGGTWIGWRKETWEIQVGPSLEGPCEQFLGPWPF